jgi:ABC-type polysaccharide/polyol phosphate transport system ATPase subunit
MINEKAIVIKGLYKEYNKSNSSKRGFLRKNIFRKNNKSFYVLKDISLEVNRGEVIGIIGPNGSGKSTLLKILSEITPPSKGSVEIYGKVASILEIGIGFQPELSGYENIFLSGKLYGLSYKQICSKLDGIIEMFGFPDFIHTEIKYYSSGMYMRLAFSLIVHIDADILLFDEVLSVGDANFTQQVLKKLEKLKSLNKTVVFVTHNPDHFLSLTNTFYSLNKGEIIRINNLNKSMYNMILQRYRESIDNKHTYIEEKDQSVHYLAKMNAICIVKPIEAKIKIDENYVKFNYIFYNKTRNCNLKHIMIIKDSRNNPLGQLSFTKEIELSDGTYSTSLCINKKAFGIYTYYFDILTSSEEKALYLLPQILTHTFEHSKEITGIIDYNFLIKQHFEDIEI